MKTILSTAIIAATLSLSATTALAGGQVEATFEREVPAVCYVTQGQRVEGKLAFNDEIVENETIGVFSNTGQIEMSYKELRVNSGDLDDRDIVFYIDGESVELGQEVVADSENQILLGMQTMRNAAEYNANDYLSATATIEIECQDDKSDNEDDEDCDKWHPVFGYCKDHNHGEDVYF